MKKEKSRPIVKIFVAYHKPGTLLKSDVFVPVHVGRGSSAETKDGGKMPVDEQWMRDNMCGDDTGENISRKNPFFCELTAQYWVWKNLKALGDPQNIGFVHYRRHLCFFSNKKFKENKFGLIDEPLLSEEYLEKYGLLDETIKEAVGNFDIITVSPWDTRNVGSKNNYSHYKESDKKLHIRDYDAALHILKELYPEYSSAADAYNASPYGYYTNIFIMSAPVFHEYCEWLFSVLFALEKEIDVEKYPPQDARVFGYVSEWLFGIFITRKKTEKKLKIKELQRTIVHNTDSLETLPRRKTPVHLEVCFASDDRYAPHLGVAIASLAKTKNPNDTASVYVLDGGISQKNKEYLRKLVRGKKLSLNFISTEREELSSLPMPQNAPGHISRAAYLRLSLPSLLPELEKVIYLDCDLVVRGDLADLMTFDISEFYMGGVVDILEKENCERLSLEKYCNSGVLLLNLKKIREDKKDQQLFEYISEYPERIIYHDQDVLNAVLQEGIVYLEPKWNAQTGEYPLCFSSGINAAAKFARIIHFIGEKKPWDEFNMQPFRDLYFDILKETPWRNHKKGLISAFRKKFGKIFIEESVSGNFSRVKILRIRILKTPMGHRGKDSVGRKLLVRALAGLFFRDREARKRFRARHLNLDPRFKK